MTYRDTLFFLIGYGLGTIAMVIAAVVVSRMGAKR